MVIKNKENWEDRIANVEEIRTYLEEHYGDPTSVKHLAQYMNDEKWEVRKAVAETIVLVHDKHLPQFMFLASDINSFVASSAKRSLERRSLYTDGEKKREKQTSTLFRNQKKILEKFGPEAVELAHRDASYAYEVTVGAAAHDLRGIITPMKAKYDKLRVLTEGFLPAKEMQEVRKSLSILEDRTDMIERIIDDIQTLARKTPAARTQELVLDLLHKAHELLKDELGAKERNIGGINVTFNIPIDMRFRVARPLLIRVFQNLLKNAYEAFLIGVDRYVDNGDIIITATMVSKGIEIVFQDNGMGMDEEMLKVTRQFRPRGASKKMTGSGFGLAIAYAKIVDHAGTLKIDSKENEGTTVTIFIPDKTEQLV